jgi:hypothetical protein
MDSTRITALYFCIVGLDILDMLSSIEIMKPKIIDYIYAMQLKPKSHFKGHKGFLGSYMGQPFGSCLCGYRIFFELVKYIYIFILLCIYMNERLTSSSSTSACSMEGHLANTYTSLAILKTLGDDFNRLDKKALIDGIKYHVSC